MARNPKQEANLKPIGKGELSKEEAKRRGSLGGKASVEKRRKKRDPREAARYILGLAAKGQFAERLADLGVPENEGTNLEALQAKLFSMAMAGNMDAYKELMKTAGHDFDENRKERESLSSERRRDMELDAKLTALGNNPDSKVSMSFGDEEGSGGVVIYLPEVEKEEDCTAEETEETS